MARHAGGQGQRPSSRPSGRRRGLAQRTLARVGVSLLYGAFIGFATLGTLMVWGYPADRQSLWVAGIVCAGAGCSVPVLYFLHSRFLPAGATLKWFVLTFVMLSVLTFGLANASYLLGHYFSLPHDHAPPWSVVGLYQIFYTSAAAELIFLASVQRLALPFTPIALILAASLFNRHFLMLHGLR